MGTAIEIKEKYEIRKKVNFNTILFLICLLGLSIRLLYFFLVAADNQLSGDASSYHLTANLFADGLGFTEPFRYLFGATDLVPIEGELVEKIQEARKKHHGLIINAGGYTHTSVAIHDALKILKIPIIELHITNIYNREEFRHKSLISKTATSIICGFGTEGYVMALTAMKTYLQNLELKKTKVA